MKEREAKGEVEQRINRREKVSKILMTSRRGKK